MNPKNIQDTAKKHVPNAHKKRNLLIAFVSGGTLAIAAQAVFQLYMSVFHVEKEASISLTIVTIIIITALLTGLGLFDKAAQTCGAGLFVPISGFANSLTSCAMEGKSEGLIFGIGSNMFKLAGSVLTYGISAAFLFGLIRFLLFGA